ncbi:sensor histidine kinase [Arenimonas caeni]|uniref:sensor histidine kinase n=1 Tax=Arenimonas caeni TaxID=2058085 RepID=UPI002A35CC21|nr:histidine kinase [Arenimonas caeni]MDY0021193.1 histidine kinase [Arenimonas caeni]
MEAFARRLFTPLNLAGLLTWAAIGWEVVVLGTGTPAWREQPAPAAWLAALHLAYLGFFACVLGHEETASPPARLRLFVLAQYGLVFALMMLARSSTLPILLILCAIQVIHLWAPRPAAVLLLVVNLGLYVIYAEVWRFSSPAIGVLMVACFQAFAASAAWFGISAERARAELAATNAELLATRSLLAESARDGERLRLSRELHDVAGHKLTALKLNLAALARDPRLATDPQVALCARLADELLADIRGVVQQMREDEGVELGPAIAALAAPFPRPRLHLQVEGDVRVASLAQAEALLRAVQEGLTNAARHSQAGNLWVVLRREGGGLRLDIRDDGRGRGALRQGNGLGGMRERFEANGGRLDVRRTDTGGVHLQAWLPEAA